MQEIATRYGVLDTFDSNDLICRCLAKYGEWAQYEVQFVADNIAPGCRIADVGAFLGTFGLGLGRLAKPEGLCFVEANAATAALLRKNVARNAPVTASVVEAVVGPFANQPQGAFEAGNRGSFSMVRAVDENQPAAAAGTTTSLSALSAEHGPFDLFKLDVEGAEKKILSEEIGFLQSSNSTFWVECNETVDSLNVAELFLNLGFSVHYFAFPAISSTPFRAGEANEAPFAYEAGLWATRGIAPRLDDTLREAGCMLRQVTSREFLRTLLWRTPRWAPVAWLDGTREEIVALAGHSLLGEAYESYLVDASVPAHATAPKWAPPIPTQLAERIQELEAQLAEERNHARAADVLLFEERRRSSLAIDRLQVELRNTFARTDALERHNTDLLSSSSWRVTMPLRMLSRAMRGDWSEIKRITRAKLRRNY